MGEIALPRFRSGSIVIALAICLSVYVDARETSTPRTCELGFPAGTTVLFVADPGTFSGTPESAVYLANLRQNKQLPPGATACPSVNVGTIMRSNVAVVTTGIDPMASAECVYDILDRCGAYIRDIFYSGTSGWSSQLGGVINNGTCESGRANNNAELARLGDLCVSPYSVNWDCRMASWSSNATGFPDQCTLPEQTGRPADEALFGQCMLPDVNKDELALADEVLAATALKRNNLPRRNNVIQALETEYWDTMSQGTRINYPALPQSEPPRIWNYHQCMEVNSQHSSSGAPWDMVARSYVADTLNVATKSSEYSQTNVLSVSAMEGIGLSMAMQRYNSLSSTKRPHSIPFTYVRGMSDWVHSPLTYTPATKVWGQGPAVENFAEGYKYAIQTASAAILSTLQVRCETGRFSSAPDDDAVSDAAAPQRLVGRRPRLNIGTPTPDAVSGVAAPQRVVGRRPRLNIGTPTPDAVSGVAAPQRVVGRRPRLNIGTPTPDAVSGVAAPQRVVGRRPRLNIGTPTPDAVSGVAAPQRVVGRRPRLNIGTPTPDAVSGVAAPQRVVGRRPRLNIGTPTPDAVSGVAAPQRVVGRRPRLNTGAPVPDAVSGAAAPQHIGRQPNPIPNEPCTFTTN